MNIGRISFCAFFAGGMLCHIFKAQAAICFLPDCEVNSKILTYSDTEYKADTEADCMNLGYKNVREANCSAYTVYSYCPYNSQYVKCDDKLWCLENGYDKTECQIPEYLSGQCPNGEPFYSLCEPNYEQACKAHNASYVNNCSSGWKIDSAQSCPYSESWGICCNTCEGYDYKDGNIPNGYEKSGSCTACGGETKYTIKAATCSGFVTCPNTPKTGTAQCLSGTTIKYKECCAYSCTLSACPYGTECSLEVCSGKYCAVGCLTGYTDYCTTPVTDCSVLGYTALGCSGDKLLCPYDASKMFCLDATKPKQVCEVGYILYSDMTCSATSVTGKTAIGVVSYVNGTNYVAISLTQLSAAKWGTEVDVPDVPNYTTSTAAKDDFAGKENTAAWVSYVGETTAYAPGYCYNYKTTGTAQGDWYVPAMGELYASIVTNKTAVTSGISLAGGTAISTGTYCSSSEPGSKYIWGIRYSLISSVARSSCVIRCSIDF